MIKIVQEEVGPPLFLHISFAGALFNSLSLFFLSTDGYRGLFVVLLLIFVFIDDVGVVVLHFRLLFVDFLFRWGCLSLISSYFFVFCLIDWMRVFSSPLFVFFSSNDDGSNKIVARKAAPFRGAYSLDVIIVLRIVSRRPLPLVLTGPLGPL